ILKFVEEGKHKEAAELAKALPTLKADPTAKMGEPLPKAVSFEDLMHQFSSERVGGFGIEKELGDLAEEKSLTPAQVDRAGTLGFKLAVVGHVTQGFQDGKNEGGMKNIKNWVA